MQVIFIFVDIDVEDNLRILEFFGLTAEDAPTYRIIHLTDVSSVLFANVRSTGQRCRT